MLVGGTSSLRRVEAPLELAEDDAEQQVAPGRLGERARVARRARAAPRAPGGSDRRRRCSGHVATCSASAATSAAHDGRARQARRGAARTSAPNAAPLARCIASPTTGHAGAARDELAEQLGVVVVEAEDALVERLLRGPHAGGDGAGEGAAGGPCHASIGHAARLYRATAGHRVRDNWHGSRAAARLHRARDARRQPARLLARPRAVLQPFFHSTSG